MKNVDENSSFLLPPNLGRIVVVVAQNRETEDACDEPGSSVCPRLLLLPMQVLGHFKEGFAHIPSLYRSGFFGVTRTTFEAAE